MVYIPLFKMVSTWIEIYNVFFFNVGNSIFTIIEDSGENLKNVLK